MIPTIQTYGDQALLINFEQKIDPTINAEVVRLKNAIDEANIDGLTFLIPAYCSLTIGYNPRIIDHDTLIQVIKQLITNSLEKKEKARSKKIARKVRIPVCYEAPYALDIQSLSEEKGIVVDEIIELHTSQIYKVYMLGFLPGFVFMGKIPEALQCSRKVTPRLSVPASSVGIAGFQTGIYPTISPGGWQILGRTPLKIFSPEKENPFLFQAGDEVEFYAITTEEYLKIKAEDTP